MEFKLYSYYRSSCSYRVRIALAYKQIEYAYIPVHLLDKGGHQNTAEYQKINSKKEVPTLIHNENPISQSMAIFEYLDEVSPATKLFPKNLLERTYVRQACEIINSGTQPLQTLWVLNKLVSDFKINDEQKKIWISDVITQGLYAFEKFISNKKGKFCFGDTLTAADMFLVPQMYGAHRFGVNLTPFKILSEINETCLSIQAFQKAHPDHQPDTPR